MCACSGPKCISQNGKCQLRAERFVGNLGTAQSEVRRDWVSGWPARSLSQGRIAAPCVSGGGRSAKSVLRSPCRPQSFLKNRNVSRCRFFRWSFSTTRHEAGSGDLAGARFSAIQPASSTIPAEGAAGDGPAFKEHALQAERNSRSPLSRELADKNGVPTAWDKMLALIENVAPSLAAVEKRLASDFPRIPWERIANGMVFQADAFKNEIPGGATPGSPAAAFAGGFAPGERLP